MMTRQHQRCAHNLKWPASFSGVVTRRPLRPHLGMRTAKQFFPEKKNSALQARRFLFF
jgi:hypothetical protein